MALSSRIVLVFGLLSFVSILFYFSVLQQNNTKPPIYKVEVNECPKAEDRKEDDKKTETVVQQLPNIKLFIAITTSYTQKAYNLRSAIRQTWVHYHNSWARNFTYFFFLGQPASGAEMPTISEAELAIGDMVFLPFMDTYKNLSMKTMHMCKYAVEHYNFDFLLKADDDMFVVLDKYVDLLKKIQPTKYFGGGTRDAFYPERGGKWAVSEEEFPRSVGPPWCAGFMYTLSYDCAKYIGDRATAPTWPRISLEDINTALAMEEYGIKPTQMNGIEGHLNDCKDDSISFHYALDWNMRDVYRKTFSDTSDLCRKIKSP